MSEPWIRVYASDMRADAGVTALNDSERYALIQAWDLAKNGPGNPAELRSQDGSYMGAKELLTLSRIDGRKCRHLFSKWARFGLCVVDDDGLVRFPNLAKRQGIDPTAAERKRRQRQRVGHGDVTPKSRSKVTAMSRHVTGENQSTEEVESTDSLRSSELLPLGESQKTRPRDLVWDALVEGCGYSPGTKTERGAWNKARKEIADQPPGMVTAKASEFKRRYPDLRCTPTALVRQWGALGETNGQRPRRPIEEILAEAEKAGF